MSVPPPEPQIVEYFLKHGLLPPPDYKFTSIKLPEKSLLESIPLPHGNPPLESKRRPPLQMDIDFSLIRLPEPEKPKAKVQVSFPSVATENKNIPPIMEQPPLLQNYHAVPPPPPPKELSYDEIISSITNTEPKVDPSIYATTSISAEPQLNPDALIPPVKVTTASFMPTTVRRNLKKAKLMEKPKQSEQIEPQEITNQQDHQELDTDNQKVEQISFSTGIVAAPDVDISDLSDEDEV